MAEIRESWHALWLRRLDDGDRQYAAVGICYSFHAVDLEEKTIESHQIRKGLRPPFLSPMLLTKLSALGEAGLSHPINESHSTDHRQQFVWTPTPRVDFVSPEPGMKLSP